MSKNFYFHDFYWGIIEEYKEVIILILKYLQLRMKIKITVSHPMNIEYLWIMNK